MHDSKALPRAVLVSALLHLGIVAFLALAVQPCSFYESAFRVLHLPEGWNPITCTQPLQLKGPVIEATLIGDTGAPPPKPVKHATPVPTVPPPPSVPPPKPTIEPPLPVKTLPPPPEHPDVRDQEKVVAEGLLKAEQERREQEEKQRQRQAEIDAREAARKKKEQKELDDLFAKMDAAAHARQKAENRARQADQQMKDLARDEGQPDLPPAPQRQSGTGAATSGLVDQYKAAIQNAVTPNWQHPDNMPDVSCVVHIVQLPGGDVMTAKVDPSCPYDEAGKRSLENAVLRTKSLPYKGFESVFERNLTLTFRPQ